jgi:hypothetical protein
LQHLALDVFLSQKQRLAAYEVQARFSLADIYDRASAAAPAAPATPATPGEPAEPAEPVAPPDTKP